MKFRYVLRLLPLLLLAPGLAHAQNCTLGTASADLDINNVRARLFNNGGLFWKGAGNVYNVPKAQPSKPITPNSIFAAGIWMGGKVGGQTRIAAAAYGSWELYPGPLDAAGNAPTDCTGYDRIFTVTKADIAAYEASGVMSDDLRAWPKAWGAPVVDGDGNPNNYNLAGGDRPEILGHETHWWVMNDAAGPHGTTASQPLKMEVQTTAFGVDLAGDLGNTTFYRYRFTYRGAQPLTDAYFGFWVDADLGNATDDYVGSDTTLDMGFVYNGDNLDEGSDGYGSAPPALGVTFLEAPEGGSARHMDVFLYYDSADPRTNTGDWYNYLQGIWQDGKPMVTCGNGYDPTGLACAAGAQPTKVMWPGDPVTGAFWSERNFDGAGNAHPPNDRKFLMSTGPHTMQPGETQELVFAIVWAKGADHLDSVARLRQATTVVRNVWAQGGLLNTSLPDAPTATPLLVAPASGATGQPARIVFSWKPTEDATDYDLELASGAVRKTLFSVGRSGVEIPLDTLGALSAGAVVSWRVRGRNAGGLGPWSVASSFTTTGEMLNGSLGGFANFLTVANAGGALVPPEYAAFAFNNSDFPHPTTGDRPDGSRQQSGGVLQSEQGWGIFTFGNSSTYNEWFDRVTRTGANLPRIVSNAFEWRFTGQSVALRRYDGTPPMAVPFELWNVGPNLADPSDDYRMIPIVCEMCGGGSVEGVFDVGGDSPLSGGANDPISDAVYWHNPKNTAPGTAGYDAYAADVASGVEASFESNVGDEVLGRIVLMGWNFGTAAYPQTTPEAGTIFRITTTPPTVSAPVPSAPLPGTELGKTATTLYWQQPVVSGTETVLQIARDAAFTDMVRDVTLHDTYYNVSALAPGTTYHWRVRQQTPSGLAGPWSAAQTFSVSPTATGIDTDAALPAALALDAPYPNPARERVTVRFGLPEAGPVRVALYDVLGREVQRLADGAHAAGWHEVTLETSSLASGLYLVRVVSEGRQQARAVVIAR